ncbi:hypothetical protein HanHA300_Chr02g0065591 [Helianthus annuus]|nr:hypothetical protein HanHA300_Chr02g0065591 [Helianthus annuus]KAJ0619688.1 hypothetical protein HanHA89_Chr02g0074031 [Helianthus annuus]KAJ0787146.1 hypothetical protein HanOQP8_Chr02g0079181 [Helianthus annuus]
MTYSLSSLTQRWCLFFLREKVCSLRTTSADIFRRRGGPNVCSLQGEEGGGGARGERSTGVRRLVDKSAWGRGEADVFGLQIFKKTNKLQESYVCAPLRDANISAQKSF